METITDKDTIRKILSMNKNVPASFIFPLKPIAIGKFIKKDKLPESWSCDSFFELNKEYPIYENEGIEFAIGNDGIGKKLVPASWKFYPLQSSEKLFIQH